MSSSSRSLTCLPEAAAMRNAHQLVHSRTRVGGRFALMPLEGYPASRLPTWPDAQVKVLASPALGAQFVQLLIDLPAGKRGMFDKDGHTETFYFVLAGAGQVIDEAGEGEKRRPGRFRGPAPRQRGHSRPRASTSVLLVRKG